MIYSLNNLSDKILKTISITHYAENIADYRSAQNNSQKAESSDLFSNFLSDDSPQEIVLQSYEKNLIWATDNYSEKGYKASDVIEDMSVIVPRVEKSKEEQKRRTKEKAEVFTPSWICNVQNNFVDDYTIGKNSFNKVSKDQRSWVPSKNVVFPDGYSWKDYVMERRLEMCCGEGPYLMSPYDTITGSIIPVRDSDGLFQRIGILDRKLRVITENANMEEWVIYAHLAMYNTFGYEWQGDNLLLARLNFIKTYSEYYKDVFDKFPEEKDIEEVAEIASWNLWQMDGLKMVEPMSCSPECVSCKKKKYVGHNGKVNVLRYATKNGFCYKTFEELLPKNFGPK